MKRTGKTRSIAQAPNNDIAATYNAFKEFEGRRYTGMKFKLAHRHSDTGKWSASDTAQRRRLIEILREMADDLENPVKAEAAPAAKAAKVRPAGKPVKRTRPQRHHAA